MFYTVGCLKQKKRKNIFLISLQLKMDYDKLKEGQVHYKNSVVSGLNPSQAWWCWCHHGFLGYVLFSSKSQRTVKTHFTTILRSTTCYVLHLDRISVLKCILQKSKNNKVMPPQCQFSDSHRHIVLICIFCATPSGAILKFACLSIVVFCLFFR